MGSVPEGLPPDRLVVCASKVTTAPRHAKQPSAFPRHWRRCSSRRSRTLRATSRTRRPTRSTRGSRSLDNVTCWSEPARCRSSFTSSCSACTHARTKRSRWRTVCCSTWRTRWAWPTPTSSPSAWTSAIRWRGFRQGPIHFAYAGWAFVDISPDSTPSPDSEFYALYDHPYSFESDSWLAAGKSSEHPVCVMNSGYSSGWCEHAFGLPLVSAEILCRAKGDDTCRFIMAPPDRIEQRIKSYIESHPEHASRVIGYKVESFLSKRTDAQLLRSNLDLERRELLSRELNARLIESAAGRRGRGRARDGSHFERQRRGPAHPRLELRRADQARGGRFRERNHLRRRLASLGRRVPGHQGARHRASAQPAVTLGVKRRDGEVSWAVYRAVATRDPATQAVTGAVVTLLDITERKRFEDKLRQTQKLESLGVLAGGIAHDFNNLLVTILGNASFAKSIAGSDPRLSPLLEQIELGAQRAAELTRQMLDYSGEGKLKTERLDLGAAVREMAKLLSALIPKQVELHYQFQAGLPAVEVDATQIRQVLMNLITNAAESMGEHSGRVVIGLEHRFFTEGELDAYEHHYAQTPAHFVVLSVKDSGAVACPKRRAAKSSIRSSRPSFKGEGWAWRRSWVSCAGTTARFASTAMRALARRYSYCCQRVNRLRSRLSRANAARCWSSTMTSACWRSRGACCLHAATAS